MGSSATPSSAPPAAFLAAFRARAGARGILGFADFMDLALYHPELGYYRRAQDRVGYGPGTDFFTATTSGPIFGELIAAAAVHLLAGQNPKDFTFVEIGAEKNTSVLTGVNHSFGNVRTIGIGERIELRGRCVVFSNELFDAQPFRRFQFRDGRWHELGVEARDGFLVETIISATTPAYLPTSASEGYVIDAPEAAARLAEEIADQPWTGLFIACDYGKSWRELIEATPAGTARAYFQHTQSNDLLARPGEQDLTCHVCWDWIGVALEKAGFSSSVLDSQEAFFIRNAGKFIASTSAAEAARFSSKKLSLLQLLHPSHLGQKFQVMHAQRF